MSNNNWWASKLGGAPAPTQQSTPVTSPPPGNTYVAQPGMPNTPVNYDPNKDQLVTKAMSSKKTDQCPNCYSGNYFAPMGTNRMRCYDCGYPVMQQGSGAGLPSGQGGAATPAKQVNQGGGFRPNVIVDRIG